MHNVKNIQREKFRKTQVEIVFDQTTLTKKNPGLVLFLGCTMEVVPFFKTTGTCIILLFIFWYFVIT